MAKARKRTRKDARRAKLAEELPRHMDDVREQARTKAGRLRSTKDGTEPRPKREAGRTQAISDIEFARDPEDGRLYALARPPELVYIRNVSQRFSEEAMNIVILELSKGKSRSWAANMAGVSVKALRDWEEKNQDFAEACREAVEIGTDFIEDEAHRRAVQGVLKPVFQQGTLVGKVVEYSDRLLEMTLKARRPDKYRERHDVRSTSTIVLKAEPGDDKL